MNIACRCLECRHNHLGSCKLTGIIINPKGMCWSSRIQKDIWSEPRKDWKADLYKHERNLNKKK